AMITLGPILVGAGLFSTSYVLALPLISDVDQSLGVQRRLLSILPFMTTSIAFTLLYILVPNCYVMRRHALIGGVVAAVLFELAKTGFGLYVRSVPTEQIYGAIAVIPLFLIWIYLSWVIVLFGAHITFCVSEFNVGNEKSGRDEGQWKFEDAFRLLSALWLAQKNGRPLAIKDLRGAGIRLPQHHVNDIMGCLEKERWVEVTEEGSWILSRDLDDVSLLNLYQAIPRRLPVGGIHHSGDRHLKGLEEFMDEHRNRLEDSLNIPLSDLLRRNG
ncbi:MAG: YihY family inner membrane protein, partial [Gammaproteobacteria bacterium]